MQQRRKFLKTLALTTSLVLSTSSNLLLADELKKFKNQQKGDKMNESQVWYITGASGGLGLALAKYLLQKGDKVAATSRKLSSIEKKLGKESENFLPLELTFDTSKGGIAKKSQANLDAIFKKWGRLDNLVNNAGYGLLGFVEEVSEKQLREQFEVNVFAPYIITQNALKIMRPQALKEGGDKQHFKARIFNLSSIGGFRASDSSTPYSMSKFALSALSEGLSLDLEDFGIAVINIMPAGFRTQFIGDSKNFGDIKIADYEAKRKAFEERMAAYNGKQPGNPEAFAKIIYELSRMKNPPLNLFVGDAAYKSARNKIEVVQKDMKKTESYAGKAADFANAGGSAFNERKK